MTNYDNDKLIKLHVYKLKRDRRITYPLRISAKIDGFLWPEWRCSQHLLPPACVLMASLDDQTVLLQLKGTV